MFGRLKWFRENLFFWIKHSKRQKVIEEGIKEIQDAIIKLTSSRDELSPEQMATKIAELSDKIHELRELYRDTSIYDEYLANTEKPHE